ncbi:hypothetical protein B296_00050395, partial [Ensete ventricosum]
TEVWRPGERLIHLDASLIAEAFRSSAHYIKSHGIRPFRLVFLTFTGVSCTSDVLQAIPFLKKAYGDSMRKVLHVGPDSCAVVSKLLKEEDTEAWGVEPYDLEDADSSCKSLVRKSFVRVADIKFPLPYRPKSFSLVIVSDSLDYLSPKYLNKTLPDLARVSADGLVIFTGNSSY